MVLQFFLRLDVVQVCSTDTRLTVFMQHQKQHKQMVNLLKILLVTENTSKLVI